MPELAATSEDTRVYEICVLLPYPLSQKEEEQAQKEIEKLLSEASGKQIAKDAWGRRGLAYRIGGFDEGNFIVYHYELNPEQIKELDENLRIVKNVLRHMIVKPPKGYQIVQYSEQYEQWQKERVQAEETRKQHREEELKKKMLERQKRQTKRAAPKKEAVEEPTPKEEGREKLTAEIDKLIADDELEI